MALGFDGKRWTIVYGSLSGLEGLAVTELYKTIQQYVPYVLTAHSADADERAFSGHNVALVGTAESNRHIGRLIRSSAIKPNTNKEGYALSCQKSCFGAGYDMAVVCGTDAAGALYGACDFGRYHADPERYADFPERIYMLRNPFVEGMREFAVSSSPAIENRGFWTWGHAVWDYRRYIDNMSRWKLNTLIAWNDVAPLNIDAVIAYARGRNVRTVWGFSWCWGEEVDPTSAAEMEKWSSRAVETYRSQYAPHGVDEIYFQMFTETHDETAGGESLAKLAADWANAISAKMLEAFPRLRIQFGLHAMSHDVRKNAGLFRRIDPRVTITWEDCGSFPYHYDANVTEGFAETLELTKQICSLRGEAEDFGAVFKGMTSLNWKTFEHQLGPFLMGESGRGFTEDRARDRIPYWKYVQANWMRNLGCLTETVRAIRDGSARRKTVTALVEDGGWEEKMWFPAALFAETLWDPSRSPEDTLKLVANTRDAGFA